MTADEQFVRRVLRETVWFALLLAYVLASRAVARAIWGGVLAGAAVSVLAVVLYDLALRRLGPPGSEWTKPRREAAARVLGGLGCLQLPLLGGLMYLFVARWDLNGPAIAAGVALPALVAALKLLGRAWTRWAQTYRAEEGSAGEPGESGRE